MTRRTQTKCDGPCAPQLRIVDSTALPEKNCPEGWASEVAEAQKLLLSEAKK